MCRKDVRENAYAENSGAECRRFWVTCSNSLTGVGHFSPHPPSLPSSCWRAKLVVIFSHFLQIWKFTFIQDKYGQIQNSDQLTCDPSLGKNGRKTGKIPDFASFDRFLPKGVWCYPIWLLRPDFESSHQGKSFGLQIKRDWQLYFLAPI